MQQSDHTRWGRGTLRAQMTQDSPNSPARSPAAGGGGDLPSLERLPEVRQALRGVGVEAAPLEHVRLSARNRLVLVGLAALAAGALVLYRASRAGLIPFLHEREQLVGRLLLGSAICSCILLVAGLFEALVVARIEDDAARYNLRRITRLIAGLALALALMSVLLESWYTALFPVGVVSLLLGLALQAPVASFIGWAYIVMRAPYRIGDRIVIGGAKGDVIDVGYFDTTLWEFGGPHLSTDHPSGRIIRLPNSSVLSVPVYNYSWPLFPYIWDEVRFSVAYGSDLEFVSKVMEEATAEQIGPNMRERVRQYRSILARTPVDEIEVQDKPVVLFRPGENTWLDAIVRYLVDPKEAGRVKTELVKKLLLRLNAEPERVLLPRGDAR